MLLLRQRGNRHPWESIFQQPVHVSLLHDVSCELYSVCAYVQTCLCVLLHVGDGDGGGAVCVCRRGGAADGDGGDISPTGGRRWQR